MDELTLDTEHIVPQQQGNRIRIQAIILRGNGMVIRYTIGNIVEGEFEQVMSGNKVIKNISAINSALSATTGLLDLKNRALKEVQKDLPGTITTV